MTNHAIAVPPRRFARLAGFLLLLSLLGPSLNFFLVFSPLNVDNDAMATANNIMANELLYRTGIAVELAFAASVMVLALCFYVILKPVNEMLASLALYWKLAEAILWAASALVTVLALQVLKGRGGLTVFNPEQLRDLVGLLLNLRDAGSYVPMVFLGLGSTVFFYLFFRSPYMPKMLAGFGMLSFALLLVPAFANILAPPESAKELALGPLQLIGALPSGLAEIAIGAWLMVKGVDVRERDTLGSGVAVSSASKVPPGRV